MAGCTYQATIYALKCSLPAGEESLAIRTLGTELTRLCCAVQPSQLPEFGIRYGIQIGQAFGYDFGIGIVKEICFVTFVIV